MKFQTVKVRKKGIYAIVESVEDIALNNQGNDLQEKIRNYLILSKEKYGEGIYVLLGGDNHIVPARLVQGDYESKTSNHKSLFAADMYYATYVGNWNGNRNNKYNERVNDSLDIDNYTAAANINNLDIAGMTTQLNGTSSDFSLIVQINMATFNEADIAAYETDFSRLSIVAKNVRDYTQYQSEIATGTGVTDYVCD